jgi:hypothetical protein
VQERAALLRLEVEVRVVRESPRHHSRHAEWAERAEYGLQVFWLWQSITARVEVGQSVASRVEVNHVRT